MTGPTSHSVPSRRFDIAEEELDVTSSSLVIVRSGDRVERVPDRQSIRHHECAVTDYRLVGAFRVPGLVVTGLRLITSRQPARRGSLAVRRSTVTPLSPSASPSA